MTNATGTLSQQATGKPSFDFKVKSYVTRELLTTQIGVVYFIRPESEMRVADQDDDIQTTRKRASKVKPAVEGAVQPEAADKPEAPKQQPPILMDIINLEDGGVQLMVVPSVLERELLRHFGDGGYVGKDLRIVKTGMKDAKAGGGKRFSLWSIQEIELPENHPLYVAPEGDLEKPVENSTKNAKKK